MTLNKIHKNSAFKIPKDYFETFDVAFFNELELKNQVKQTGYKTPEDYFIEFDAPIPKTLKANNSRKLNKKYSFYISGIAAALVLLFMFSLPSKEAQEISLESIENYLINEEYQSDVLENLLLFEDLNEISILELSYSEVENYIFQNASIETLLID